MYPFGAASAAGRELIDALALLGLRTNPAYTHQK